MVTWEIKKRKYENLIDQLLFNRGVSLGKEKELFLHPDFANLYDPYLMSGIKEAVERIKKASQDHETIGVFGDYDADGIPGAALLYRTFKKIGLNTKIFIPNRNDGYGLSQKGIDFLASEKCSLIVTVDLGIRNITEAVYCREKKIDLIITDHHTPGEELPEPDVLINPKIKGDKYPFKELAGCGVAYKLAQALSKEFRQIDEKFLKWNLDLVAIATISDVVPLISENRILAKFGLVVLQKTQNTGLKALYGQTGIEAGSIDAYVTGFQIAPRINAPGRVDHASKSFELLVTEDEAEAEVLAKWLEEKNLSRQKAMDDVERQALEIIAHEKLDKNKIIILEGQWAKGVIGPTSSRLVEKLSRPVILFAEDKESFSGSARSVSEVNILELIAPNAEFIKKFGGHKGAAGLTVLKEKFSKFKKALIDYANKKIDSKYLIKKIKAEGEIKPREIGLKVAEIIGRLEPFGMGNPRPVFFMPEVRVSYLRRIGKDGKHYSFALEKDGLQARCVFFNPPEEYDLSSGLYDLMFNIKKEVWKEKEYLKLFIVDMRKYEKI